MGSASGLKQNQKFSLFTRESKKWARCPVAAFWSFFFPQRMLAKHLSVVNGCCCLISPLGFTPVITTSSFEPSAPSRSEAHTHLNLPWCPHSEGWHGGCVHLTPYACGLHIYKIWQMLSGDVTQQIQRYTELRVCVCLMVWFTEAQTMGIGCVYPRETWLLCTLLWGEETEGSCEVSSRPLMQNPESGRKDTEEEFVCVFQKLRGTDR